MEYQHHPIYTHRPDMCLYSSDSHSYQKRHRTATDRMVCICHHIYNQRILAEKPWFQLQGPSFFIFNGRCPNPYHLVGHPLFLLLYRCGKLRRTLQLWQPSFSPLAHFRRHQRKQHLLSVHCNGRALRSGNLRTRAAMGVIMAEC